jgi:ATP-dependent DNA ligase
VYDPGMTAQLEQLRPAAFGRRNVKQITDPVIEPMWRGDRVLVEIADGNVTVRDPEGREVETEEHIVAELAAGLRAESAVIDGYLTYQATQPTTKLAIGSEVPTAGQMATQMFVGKGFRSRVNKPAEELEQKHEVPDHPLALVAVDLLVLDGQSLLDIPLLERKRLLESVLAEGALVRRTAFVRPPVDAWLASWRSMGFSELAYKGANSRYQPGARNEDWAIVSIPST